MCEPTPVSTVFETSSITRYQTATSSTPILHTPTPSISIIVQSSCVRFQNTQNAHPLSSSLTTSLPTESSTRWWKGEWGQDDAARRTTDRHDGGDDSWNGRDAIETRVATSIAAIALNVEKTATTDFISSRSREERAKTKTRSYKTALPASTTSSDSQAPSSSLRDNGVDVGETATNREERDRGRHRIAANAGRSDLTSNVGVSLPTTTTYRGRHHFVHRQECEEWVTTTLTLTVSFPVETSWSTVEMVKTDVVVTSRPIETILASCPVTTAASTSSAAMINAIQTEESSSPSSVITSFSDISSLETSSKFEILSTSGYSAVPTVSSISSSSMAATTRQFSSLSLKPLPYPTASPKPLANANDPIDSPASLSTASASQTAAPANDHTESSSMSKGATAGAVIGGILALLLLLATVLVTTRYIMKKKRQDRTRELRSSWFYGGDIVDPAEDEKNKTQPEQRFSHLQSRFSAPSFSSRESKYAMPLAGFLALPIKHVRAASGRLPDVFNNFRQSVQQHSGFAPMNASTRVGTDLRTGPSHANTAKVPLRVPPLPPHVAEVTPIGAFFAPPHRSVHDPPPTGRSNGSDRMETMIPSPGTPPRISLHGLGESDFGWTDSRGSPRILADSLPSEYSQFDPLPGMRKHGLHIVNGPPPESYYSVYSNLSAPHSELLSYDSRQIGQAISAPGRESIELAQNPGILIRPPSGARDLVPVPTAVPDNLTAPLAPLYGLSTPRSSAAGHSSLFEYSGYDPRRVSHMTHASASTRATRNWYEQSLYGDSGQQGELADRASRSSFVSGIWTMHGGEGNDESHRKSRSKSVRWGDEEPMPKVTNGRHAL